MGGYNSTIVSKKKKCVGCNTEQYIFSKGRCKACASKDFKPIKRVSDKRMVAEFSDESWTNLRDELDTVFSLYIRLKDANADGYNSCFTCGEFLHYKQLHNGHCNSRGEIGSRFLTENCRPQCPKCNSKHETYPEIFRNKLEAENKGILEYLDNIAHSVNKLSVSDLKELLLEYRSKLLIVQSKLKK